ncbi:MAG: hypothetical protein RXN88_04240 [Acidilobus sp.]|uniref:hypothetical protein n=1 Tax=Acidilobus sp. 7A TaxID=1577685 RepID=UPI0015762400|nr:hypothetical protein [Acidilobus sp. 7A]
MTKWKVRCTECGLERFLETGFDLSTLKGGRIYIYCPRCKRNTFHEIIGRSED